MTSLKKLISVFMLVATMLFNTSCEEFKACVSPLADLLISAASLTSPTAVFTTGAFYPFVASISNVIQCVSAGGSQTNLNIGYSATPSSNPNAYARVTSASTPTGQIDGNCTTTINRQVSFNRAGYYLITVIADNGNNVTEENENNNDYSTSSATIRSANAEPPLKGILIEVKQGGHIWKEGEPMAEIK